MGLEEVTVLELYQFLQKIVNKYPYYKVEVFDEFTGSITGSKALLPGAYIVKDTRKLWLKTNELK